MGFLAPLALLAALAPATPALAAEESLGYRIELVAPNGPRSSVVVIAVTAPGTGTVFGSFTLSTAAPEDPLQPVRRKGESGIYGSILSAGNARLDGPGALSQHLITSHWALRDGCLREGSLYWHSAGWDVALAAGESTRIVVDVASTPGLASVTPTLKLTPYAWRSSVGDRGLVGPTTAEGLAITAPIPRPPGTGRDAVSVSATSRSAGTYRLTGAIDPPRAGQGIAIVGRRTGRFAYGGFTAVDDAVAPVKGRERVFARARTDAAGRWSAVVRAAPKTTLVARTTGGLPGRSMAGASCPVWLAPRSGD